MDRALLVGTRSLGKGLVQNVRQLPYNTQLKITTAKYYIPSGRCVQAIDYSHKDANGKPVRLPDSLRKEFKTAGGRSVYDGAGIEPDIIIPDTTYQLLTQELVIGDYIFNFVNQYALKNSAPANVNDYVIPQGIYEQFTDYVLENQDFKHTTGISNIVGELSNTLKKFEYSEEIIKLAEQLKDALKPDLKQDMIRYRKEIEEALIDQLITRYYDNEGYIEYTVKNRDIYIDKALENINNNLLKQEK
jgi:carboxyl-terminal processing protease